MTGLDKMINQILDEANNSANEKLESAKAQVQEILDTAKKEANARCEEISRKSSTEVAAYRERIASSADLQRRTAMLETKQEIISSVIEKAYTAFCSKNESEYFETVKAILKSYVLPQAGEIYFSKADLERMPKGLEDELKKIAQDKGGDLTVSDEARVVEGGGFILAYGGIEENCSFRALFDSKRDELQDKVQKTLFS